MTITGRIEELEILSNVYESKHAEFLAVYGRRRVGKTFLIREFFQNKSDALFFNVTSLKDGTMAEQIANVMDRIGETFYGGARLEKTNNWRDTFKALNEAIEKCHYKKIIIFIDEIPWMATPKSKLLQNIDYFWNQYWSANSKIKFIICGSSASWIIDKIINNKGGLHNRITEKICLEPFNLSETKNYLKHNHINLDNHQILLIYMVTGGVPFYLSKIKWKGSAMQIIGKLAFSKKAFFVNEFDNLFSSLFKNHETHIKIVVALSKNKDGLEKTKLLELIDSSGGSGMKKLQELEDAGFIMRFNPLYHKRKNTYYRLIDEYSYFYLKWIEPIKTLLQNKSLTQSDWQSLCVTPEWHNWLGYAFEMVCYKHLVAIKEKLNLPPMSLASTWKYTPKKNSNERGAQIDLLFDRRDNAITICEVKYTEKPFLITKDYFEILNRKLVVFKQHTRTQKQLLVSFVSANGIIENPYSDELVQSVATLDDLFQE
ncbi:MAG: hypothetical protein A3E82_08225 [Gammaproteobacteria bacterium RIFCSPHIGHO2_12_FULL_38_11]|nr:MAG: hypothetical protein A3E82_08225 [Gammaproteobacteria bacterium RIFCSPHIGHO2_12_FULL_38_11]